MGKSKKHKKEKKAEKKERKEKERKEKEIRKALRNEAKSLSKTSTPCDQREGPSSYSSSLAETLQQQLVGEMSAGEGSQRLTSVQRKNEEKRKEMERIYNERLINKPEPSSSGDAMSQSSSRSHFVGNAGNAATSGETGTPLVEEREVNDKDINEAAASLLRAEMAGQTSKLARLRTNLENLRVAKSKGMKIRIKRKKPGPSFSSHQGLTRTSTLAMSGRANPDRGAYQSSSKGSVADMVRDEKRKSARDVAYEFTRMQMKMGMDDYFQSETGTVHEDKSRKRGTKESGEGSSQSKDDDDDNKGSTSQRSELPLNTSCEFCIHNRLKHLVLSVGENCFLTLPTHESLVEGHCYIVPLRHVPSGCHVDDETWEEVLKFRQQLAKMVSKEFGSNSELVVIETAMRLHRFPHAIFECIPVTDNEDIPFISAYFKKAFLEAGPKWATNKKLLEFKTKNLRHAVPKGFPYVSVSFELQSDKSYAHVIDDESLYDKYFLTEIIGGIIDADSSLWRKPRKEEMNMQLKKAVQFEQMWSPFDLWEES